MMYLSLLGIDENMQNDPDYQIQDNKYSANPLSSSVKLDGSFAKKKRPSSLSSELARRRDLRKIMELNKLMSASSLKEDYDYDDDFGPYCNSSGYVDNASPDSDSAEADSLKGSKTGITGGSDLGKSRQQGNNAARFSSIRRNKDYNSYDPEEFDDDDADTDNAPTISLARVMENDIP
jgi:hypothetical protein